MADTLVIPEHLAGCLYQPDPDNQPDDWRMHCAIQPGARKSGFAGLHDGCIRIRIASPPVDGKANKALIDFLAKAFAVRKQQVSLLKGETSRRKVIGIDSPRQLPVIDP